SAPTNSKGYVRGLELSVQQPIANTGFGVMANYTYADAKEKRYCAASGSTGYDPTCTGGNSDLVGASKSTYNVSGYYENSWFGARLAYTYRSHFFVGLDRSTPE